MEKIVHIYTWRLNAIQNSICTYAAPFIVENNLPLEVTTAAIFGSSSSSSSNSKIIFEFMRMERIHLRPLFNIVWTNTHESMYENLLHLYLILRDVCCVKVESMRLMMMMMMIRERETPCINIVNSALQLILTGHPRRLTNTHTCTLSTHTL